MAQYFQIHAHNPQPRLIRLAAELLRGGAVIVYPTDSCYALGCRIADKEAEARIRAIRGMDAKHLLSLVCRDLSEIGKFAVVNNTQYRILRAHTPGSYTFVLKASREVPRRLMNGKRATIGVRVPDHRVTLALLEELGEPLLSATLLPPGAQQPLNDPVEIRTRLERQVDLVIDAGSCGIVPTTVIDLSQEQPRLVRAGKGESASFGL